MLGISGHDELERALLGVKGLAVAFGGEQEIFLNALNVFDKLPPVFGGTTGGNAYTYLDDTIGRYITVGIRGKF